MAMQAQMVSEEKPIEAWAPHARNWMLHNRLNGRSCTYACFCISFTLVMMVMTVMGCSAVGVKSKGSVSERDIDKIKDLLQVVDNANRMKYEHDGAFAKSVDELIRLQYLAIDSSMQQQFVLSIHILDPQHRLVAAASTSKFSGGPDWIFEFDSVERIITIQFRK